MKKFFKILLIAIVTLFILAQFIPRPEKNISAHTGPNDISISNKTTSEVQEVLKRSCYDCHSNNTTYPWYASVQPVAWWLGDHIEHAKKELNFSEFGSYEPRRKYRKLEEVIEEIEDDKMPLPSYTIIHRDARLSAQERQLLVLWAQNERSRMQEIYPADSLVKK